MKAERGTQTPGVLDWRMIAEEGGAMLKVSDGHTDGLPNGARAARKENNDDLVVCHDHTTIYRSGF